MYGGADCREWMTMYLVTGLLWKQMNLPEVLIWISHVEWLHWEPPTDRPLYVHGPVRGRHPSLSFTSLLKSVFSKTHTLASLLPTERKKWRSEAHKNGRKEVFSSWNMGCSQSKNSTRNAVNWDSVPVSSNANAISPTPPVIHSHNKSTCHCAYHLKHTPPVHT